MPIIVKDYSWNETDKTLFITVPLKGVTPKKVDIFSTETYIKVYFPPYLFECFLLAPVEDQSSAAEIGNGVIVFKLNKQEAVLWNQLHHPQSDDVGWKKEQRELSVQRSQQRAEENKQIKAVKKTELDKYGVKQQMKLEQGERQFREDAKQHERDTATASLEDWKEQQEKLLLQQEELSKMEQEIQEVKLKAESEEREREKKTRNSIQNKQIFKVEAGTNDLREPGKIAVTFTPRTFPTPSRESTAHDEEAWLKKQAESRRIIELENADLSVEERNPVWLRDKGNAFFKAGNYQAAVNVFSHAIRLDAKMPAMYSNRGACHLKLGNYFKCMEDCSRALELLTPPVPQNATHRCKAHIRRGTALCQLELYVEGLQDYEAALKLEPNNDTMKEDAQKIRNIIQSSSSYS